MSILCALSQNVDRSSVPPIQPFQIFLVLQLHKLARMVSATDHRANEYNPEVIVDIFGRI